MTARESCDLHAHSILRPCVNGSTTYDYLRDELIPVHLPEEWTP